MELSDSPEAAIHAQMAADLHRSGAVAPDNGALFVEDTHHTFWMHLGILLAIVSTSILMIQARWIG